MAQSQSTHVAPPDDWVRAEIRAVLRGEEVKPYPYDKADDLDDALRIFAKRQSDYAVSIASGVRRLEVLVAKPDQGAGWVPSSVAAVGKRMFDILCAALILVLCAPLLAVIAIAIKLDSPGPLLFRQVRMGRGGRPFTIMKFRTMVIDPKKKAAMDRSLAPEPSPMFKLERDPRITRVGRFLRLYSLDELPQLFNVLQGDMSLVGPRALIVEVAESIPDPERHPSLTLKPGLTGVSQLAGVPFDEAIKLEDDYATGWSALRDLAVLGRTLARRWRPSYH